MKNYSDIAQDVAWINGKIMLANAEIEENTEDIMGVYKELPTGKDSKGWKKVTKREAGSTGPGTAPSF